MTTVQTTVEQTKVLAYLKNMKKITPRDYTSLMLWGVNPNDIIKLIERPDACGKWPFEYVSNIYTAIRKIPKHNILPFPEIEVQTEEDRVLSKKKQFNCIWD